jgi:hypothetical protein
MSHYIQTRIAKRNGEIVQQKRDYYCEVYNPYPWWQFWKVDYSLKTECGEWVDVPIPDADKVGE